MAKKNGALLEEIRDRYSYALKQWKDIREEAKIDKRYAVGDPWDEKDKRMRRDAGRPCLSMDEISQYLNQAINNVRQSKVGIKVEPAGNQATDKTAELQENVTRGIEYRSNAWRNAYLPAYESALQCSYGYFKITREYESDDSFNQVICIKGIVNADSVVYDPDCREADWSDAGYCFELEPVTKDEFKRKYPKAERTDFNADDAKLAPDWIREDHIVVAAYWKIEVKSKELVQGDKKRTVEKRSVCQYITNGIEILEENPQPGTYIPIVPVIGKEIYVDDGSGPKRRLLSMVRLARDPQMLYNYLVSQEAEEAAMSPKAPFIGAKGQFESDAEAWQSVNKIPHVHVQYDPVVEAAPGQVLPPPTRPQFEPNFQAYEIAKDSARRAIMSAVGITPLPTAAQRNNEKSGIALAKISQEQSIGSFHFVDNLYRALELAGRIIEQWKPIVYDTERELGVRKADGSHEVLKINTPEPLENGDHHLMDVGSHDVTVSVGPSFQSEREEAADFGDTLLQHVPQITPQILDLLVRMRNLGPLGDEIAERLTPPQFAQPGSPQEAAGKLQQAQQQLQQAQAMVQELNSQIGKLQMEKMGKLIETQGKTDIEKLRLENQLAVAEISTKSQNISERVELLVDMMKQLHSQSHEFAMQKDQQAHEADQAAQSQQQPAQ